MNYVGANIKDNKDTKNNKEKVQRISICYRRNFVKSGSVGAGFNHSLIDP